MNLNKLQKKRILFIVFIITLISAISIYAYSAKYELSNITADNFNDILKRDNNHIYDMSGIQNYIPDKIPIILSKNLIPSNNFNNNGFEVFTDKSSTRSWTHIKSFQTKLMYSTYFNLDEKLVAISIGTTSYDPQIKIIIEKLIINCEFVLKESDKKNGKDIIIKETDESFIIGEIISTYENPNPPMSITFTSFSKKKYLRV